MLREREEIRTWFLHLFKRQPVVQRCTISAIWKFVSKVSRFVSFRTHDGIVDDAKAKEGIRWDVVGWCMWALVPRFRLGIIGSGYSAFYRAGPVVEDDHG
jgi:hypothetical protein